MPKFSTAYLIRGIGLSLPPLISVALFGWQRQQRSEGKVISSTSAALVALSPIVVLAILDFIECHRLKKQLRLTASHYANDKKKQCSSSLAENGRNKMAKQIPKRTGKRYLVVGTGGVGRRMIEILKERGEEHVYGFDVCSHSRVNDILDENCFISGDVTSLSSCKDAINNIKPDIIFHTAAVITYSQRKSWQWDLSYNANVKGVLNMLQASTEAQTVQSFILTSSSTAGLGLQDCYQNVSGDEGRFQPVTSKQQALSWYTRSKAMAEVEAMKYFREQQQQQNTTTPAFGIIRPASGIFHHRDGFLIQDALNKVLSGGATAIGFEHIVMDYVYVDNVVLGHLLLEKQLSEGKCNGETFIISNREPLSAFHLFARLATMVVPLIKMDDDTSEIVTNYDIYWKLSSTLVFVLCSITELFTSFGLTVPRELGLLSYTTITFATVGYIMDDTKAQKMLGYNPAFTVDEGLLQTIEDYIKDFPDCDLAKARKKKI